MKTQLKELIKSHYKDLAEVEIEELAEKLCDLLPAKKLRLSEIKAGEKFKYAGHEFTKLADEEKSCYCLLNDAVFESKFGETNDWAKSPIRKRLNEFDGQGNSKAVKGIVKDDLVAVSLNYTAYKIPNGRSTDFITCPSYEEYWSYSFSPIDKYSWLRSGNYNYAYYAYLLGTSGGSNGNGTNYYYAVRPALHLKKELEVEL